MKLLTRLLMGLLLVSLIQTYFQSSYAMEETEDMGIQYYVKLNEQKNKNDITLIEDKNIKLSLFIDNKYEKFVTEAYELPANSISFFLSPSTITGEERFKSELDWNQYFNNDYDIDNTEEYAIFPPTLTWVIIKKEKDQNDTEQDVPIGIIGFDLVGWQIKDGTYSFLEGLIPQEKHDEALNTKNKYVGYLNFRILINPEYRRKGYGESATLLLSRTLFDNTNIKGILGSILSTNEPSIGAFKKAGGVIKGEFEKTQTHKITYGFITRDTIGKDQR